MNKRAGFALAEAVIGMAVAGILVVAIYALQMSVVQKVQLGREDLRATEILVKKTDQLRLFRWEQITNGITVPTNFTELLDPALQDLKVKPKTAIQNITYNGRLVFENGPSECTYGGDMKLVTVTVEWASATGMQRQRSVQTYLAKDGMQNYDLEF